MKWGEYILSQTIYIVLSSTVLFFVLFYYYGQADYKLFILVGFATWIAMVIFILIIGQMTKAGMIRNPSSVLHIPKLLNRQ